jgi:hypothetical protein
MSVFYFALLFSMSGFAHLDSYLLCQDAEKSLPAAGNHLIISHYRMIPPLRALQALIMSYNPGQTGHQC